METCPNEPLPRDIADALHAELHATAAEIFDAVPREVPAYSEIFTSELGERVQTTIEMMLAGFLFVSCGPQPDRRGIDPAAVESAAFQLGQYEAQVGRSVDALNASFRLGARIAWRHWSAAARAHGMSIDDMSRFAELNFYYIDTLADAAVSGHADELDSVGRQRQRAREQLAENLLTGATLDEILLSSRLAEWKLPTTMLAIALPRAETRNAMPLLDPHTLLVSGSSVPRSQRSDMAVLLVPVSAAASRAALLARLSGVSAAVGGETPWLEVRYSAALAVRAWEYRAHKVWPVDTESILAELIVHADLHTRDRHRAAVLAPFDHLRAETRACHEETLRAWLLHQGRREDVARYLVLHPQTVRYRMDRIREILGDRMTDPDRVLDLIISLV